MEEYGKAIFSGDIYTPEIYSYKNPPLHLKKLYHTFEK